MIKFLRCPAGTTFVCPSITLCTYTVPKLLPRAIFSLTIYAELLFDLISFSPSIFVSWLLSLVVTINSRQLLFFLKVASNLFSSRFYRIPLCHRTQEHNFVFLMKFQGGNERQKCSKYLDQQNAVVQLRELWKIQAETR